MIDNSLITAKSISYKINENKLFHNLSFELTEGSALLIKGKNGSGKSTLLRIILGITVPTKGNIYKAASIQICYLGHKNALKSYLTMRDNIDLMQLNNHKELNNYLDLLSLKKHLDVTVSSLSFGQQKKLALLRVFLNTSKLLILDEPFVGLDDTAHEQLTKFLSNELIMGKGLIFTSHIPCGIKAGSLKLIN